ncbi:MAG: nucleotidyl transferase AbiEii/AbiGii toxin family protein [Bacilli bacterium]|nr:nucleotidyl transferase AbiEii/AbiGii toxin family protein [Bacilli bacterium]
MMHLEILDEKRIELLRDISKLSFINLFSMGEGTALSLQLGLRYSYDFDFFTNEHFDTKVIVTELREMFGDKLEITNVYERLSTVDALIDGVQVSFFEYRHPEIGETVNLEGFPGICLLSIRDIAAMKCIAIIQRGTKKDFYDLFFILKDQSIKNDLHLIIKEKYGELSLLSGFFRSMTYYVDAESDILPKSFVPYSWDEIKKFFAKYSKEFFSKIMNTELNP